jgi:transcriptional regulator with XRE-family HTH domain
MNMKDFNRAMGAVIRKHRLARGLSQSDVAKALGVSYQQVSKAESGANAISAHQLTMIAPPLDVTVAQLYEEASATRTEGASPDDEINAELFLIARYFRLLPAAQRKAQVYYLKMLTALQGAPV